MNFVKVFLASSSLIVMNAYATDHQYPKCPGVHTWHTISTQEGEWRGHLAVINQEGGFVDENCQEVSKFSFSSETPFIFGMYFNRGADFNFTYSLSMAKQPGLIPLDKKYPICHFLVSAYGPANPQVLTSAMNDADCNWERVPKIGQDFTVN